MERSRLHRHHGRRTPGGGQPDASPGLSVPDPSACLALELADRPDDARRRVAQLGQQQRPAPVMHATDDRGQVGDVGEVTAKQLGELARRAMRRRARRLLPGRGRGRRAGERWRRCTGFVVQAVAERSVGRGRTSLGPRRRIRAARRCSSRAHDDGRCPPECHEGENEGGGDGAGRRPVAEEALLVRYRACGSCRAQLSGESGRPVTGSGPAGPVRGPEPRAGAAREKKRKELILINSIWPKWPVFQPLSLPSRWGYAGHLGVAFQCIEIEIMEDIPRNPSRTSGLLMRALSSAAARCRVGAAMRRTSAAAAPGRVVLYAPPNARQRELAGSGGLALSLI